MKLGCLVEKLARFLMMYCLFVNTFWFMMLLIVMSHPRLTAPQRELILFLAGQRLGARAIARRVPCAPRTVSYTIQRFVRTGSTEQRSSRGRPSSVSPAVQPDLVRLLRRNTGTTSADLAGRLRRMGVARISSRSVRRFRQQYGFRSVAPHEEIPLSESSIARRLAWCHQQRGNHFNTTIFSDEKAFLIDNRSHVHFIQADQPVPTTIPHQRHAVFMVWGAVSYHHRSPLHFEPEIIDHEVYIRILSSTLLPNMGLFRRHTLLQDNASPHRHSDTLEWLEANNIPVYHDYPPNSPELNAIEYVWGWMKNYIAARDPRTSRRLGELIQEAWDAIPQHTIQSYIDHVYHLTVAVRAAGGRHAHS